jgi:hypothetical protein
MEKKNIWTELIEENEEFFVFVYKINVYKINWLSFMEWLDNRKKQSAQALHQ